MREHDEGRAAGITSTVLQYNLPTLEVDYVLYYNISAPFRIEGGYSYEKKYNC